MYPVTDLYKEKIKENNRLFECKIQIEHSQGTLYLDDKDLVAGSLTYTESSQAGEEFTVGGTVASDISFTILNKPEYHDITFMGATVFVNIGLQVKEGIDAHFLQPSQPSKMKGYEEKWEYVPLGRFNIDDVNRQRNTIQLKAIDNMINLDKPYSLSKLSYPATLYQIYVNICNVADIPVGTTNFPNKDYVVKIRPDGDLTLRDVLGYVAELAGCFAKCNRHGALELRWYEPTDITLGPQNRFNFKPSDDIIQIKGVMYSTEDTTYLAGSDEYAIDLSENPLLQGDYETVLPNIYNNVKDTVFTPYTSDWQGNPAIQAGDIITQIDRDGKVYNTLVTKSVYKYRGRSILEAKGFSELARGYKGSTNRKIAEIRRKIDVEVGDKLTTLEEQQLQATELIANMLGGYAIKTDDAFYIADNEDLSKAKKVWKWGIGGFGYSENGVDGPYTTAVTIEGSIVAELVAAGIITADMVQTGILQSQDGSTWINLNNGTFNLKDKIKFVNNKFNLSLEGTDASTEVDERINSAKSEIKITTDEISSIVSNVQTDIGGLETRMSSAESKITPDAITNTVESTTTKLATKAEVTSEINSAKSSMEQYADSIVSTVRTIANNASSKADSADSKASTAITNASTAIQTANDVSFEFTQLKNLSTGQELSGGRTTINRDGIRVEHTGLGGQYSEMRADGFVRKWQYGEAKYLNDIYVTKFYEDGDDFGDTKPSPYRIYLPVSFRGRTNVQIIPIPLTWDFYHGNSNTDGTLSRFARKIFVTCKVAIESRTNPVELKDLNANPPYVDIDVYKETVFDISTSDEPDRFEGIDWMLLVVGE